MHSMSFGLWWEVIALAIIPNLFFIFIIRKRDLLFFISKYLIKSIEYILFENGNILNSNFICYWSILLSTHFTDSFIAFFNLFCLFNKKVYILTNSWEDYYLTYWKIQSIGFREYILTDLESAQTFNLCTTTFGVDNNMIIKLTNAYLWKQVAMSCSEQYHRHNISIIDTVGEYWIDQMLHFSENKKIKKEIKYSIIFLYKPLT